MLAGCATPPRAPPARPQPFRNKAKRRKGEKSEHVPAAAPRGWAAPVSPTGPGCGAPDKGPGDTGPAGDTSALCPPEGQRGTAQGQRALPHAERPRPPPGPAPAAAPRRLRPSVPAFLPPSLPAPGRPSPLPAFRPCPLTRSRSTAALGATAAPVVRTGLAASRRSRGSSVCVFGRRSPPRLPAPLLSTYSHSAPKDSGEWLPALPADAERAEAQNSGKKRPPRSSSSIVNPAPPLV